MGTGFNLTSINRFPRLGQQVHVRVRVPCLSSFRRSPSSFSNVIYRAISARNEVLFDSVNLLCLHVSLVTMAKDPLLALSLRLN